MLNRIESSSARVRTGLGLTLLVGATVAAGVWVRGSDSRGTSEAVTAHRASRSHGSARASRALRSDYGAHANEVLRHNPSIEVSRAGFELVREDLAREALAPVAAAPTLPGLAALPHVATAPQAGPRVASFRV